MTALPDGPLIAWVGDDFTGAAATLEVLTFAGLASVLFLTAPTAAQRDRFKGARGIGLASTARAQSPAWMDHHLPAAFDALRGFGAPIIHYKVCSTLDSAPGIGSIGRAIELGRKAFADTWVAVLIAAPQLRRYQAFGHLFAGAPGGVYRLDRHPSMAHHPVTPMHESDVCRHLAAQTDAKFGVISLEDLADDAERALAHCQAAKQSVIAFDAMTDADMAIIGGLLWRHQPRFVVGSQGIQYALVEHWRASGQLPAPPTAANAGPVACLPVVSGSVSPVSAAQIAWAEHNGFAVIQLDAAGLARGDAGIVQAALDAALIAIDDGRDPLICSARGPDDPAVAALTDTVNQLGLNLDQVQAEIGAALGQLLKSVLLTTGLRRAVVAGGDSAGFVCQCMDIYALTALAQTVPGAPLMQAHSEDPAWQGLELALKGGQMGSADFFGWIKAGAGPQ
ncbi:four-carbon acid sugar kinase family protein [Litorivicinus lipolyticus]|uniref:Four-carbon acid sugar kinase family protein n=1 Tax=Litorivicinus lipolyticus TaxID=418701 RepID=A0A5Q2QBZ9_9GAMM|nr:four-carbon acid sugar kinase family protein [Litorivicinus lipolyticus]QGG79536.1 four-carbon acid sugar kinase family protein [Litorivicinus lipolyticus]